MKEIGRYGIEAYLKRRVKEAGGMAEKHVSPGRKGVPDQLVTWDSGWMDLVETKAPKGRLSDSQIRDHARRARRGVKVIVLYTKQMVDDYIEMKSLL
jgi:VRR-NUC domain